MPPLPPEAGRLVSALRAFTLTGCHAPQHRSIAQPFDELLARLDAYRKLGGALESRLATEIFLLVERFLDENNKGRRPWRDEWENWFWRCMRNAHALLDVVRRFPEFPDRLPLGFSGRVDHVFELNCFYEEEYEDLARYGAQIFAWTAEPGTVCSESWLEHPDDEVFTLLLTGLARGKAGRAQIARFLDDDEAWVRALARRLLDEPPPPLGRP
jgi:hypothetical protein